MGMGIADALRARFNLAAMSSAEGPPPPKKKKKKKVVPKKPPKQVLSEMDKMLADHKKKMASGGYVD